MSPRDENLAPVARTLNISRIVILSFFTGPPRWHIIQQPMVDLTMSHTPRSITMVVWGMVLFGCGNIWRAISLAQQSLLLVTAEATLSPTVRLIGSVVWTVVFAAQAFLLWRRRPVVRRAIPPVILLYGAYQLGLVVFFVASPAAKNGWLAQLVFYASASLLAYWLLNRRATAHFWRVTNKTPW